MIYLVYQSYVPNTAYINRALGYFHSIEQLRIPVNVIFFLPDEKYSKIQESFHYVKIVYYWEKFHIENSKLKYVSYAFNLLRFVNSIKKDDQVYVYGYNDICKAVLFKKGVRLFFEITENPEISLPSSPLYMINVERHLKICSKISGLIVISNSLKEYYQSKGVKSEMIHVVNMFVDDSRFRNITKCGQNKRYIAYCGTASNNKDGVDILIKAFGLIASKYSDVQLFIIGETPSKKESNSNLALIKSMRLENRVVFTGRISSIQIPQILMNAELLALARPDNIQARFGFPTKLGEYLLTGNPVVVTSVGDIPLFLQDNISAYVVTPNSPNAFAEKISWVLDHQEQAKIVGEYGKAIALQYFNASTETRKLMDIIQA